MTTSRPSGFRVAMNAPSIHLTRDHGIIAHHAGASFSCGKQLADQRAARRQVVQGRRVQMLGRGAGIVTHPQLLDALTECGAQIDPHIGVEVTTRIALARW